MSKSERYTAYDDFAWVYNRHWGSSFTARAMAVIEGCILPRIPSDARILDLCCGTGQLAAALCETGYKVTGIDGSEQMLKYARENAPRAEFVQDDARTFKAPVSYDAVVSMFDSLNHVMTIGELRRVFERVHHSLRPNGLFLFDVNTEAGYLENWQGLHGIVEEDHVCIFPNTYDSEAGIGTVDFTIFRVEDEGWRRTDFQLTQKCHAMNEVVAALESSGMRDVEALAFDVEKGTVPVDSRAKKVFFLCRS